MPSSKKPATRCVHAGRAEDRYGAVRPPVYHTTTFAFDTTAELKAAEAAGGRPFYTRYGDNPTILAVEQHLAALENAEAALLFTAGMAAISTTCLALGRDGVVCAGNAYGGTLELLSDWLPHLGIPAKCLADSGASDELDRALDEGAGLVIIETPGNPDLAVQDIRALADRVHARGARLAVDNTFATPINQQPLALGADLVLHSATKYLGGHSDLTAGAAMGSRELIAVLNGWRRQLGQTPAPETADRLERSLATLAVRVERQNETAARIATAMENHPGVKRVLYPGLASLPGHDVARQQMRGFGGMLALEIAGPAETATAVVDNLRLFLNAPSLGGVESLATQPAVTSHAGLGPDERRQRGIGNSLVRLSIGLEDADDLIADLEQAMKAAGCTPGVADA